MADPFAILANSRLDVPGLLSAYQAGRQGRMQDMLFQRQIAREDRQEETDIKRQGVMARLFQPKGGGQSPQGARPQQAQNLAPEAVGAGMGAAMLDQPPQQLMDPRQLPPRTDGITLNPAALAELYQIDPKGALEIQNLFYSADKAGFERAQQNGETMFKAATLLQGVPPEQRQAVFQSMMPQLRALGVPDDQLMQVDLSDQGLANYAQLGNTLANIADARKPVSMSPGEVMMDPMTQQVTLRSPEPRIIVGADGVQYALPPGGVDAIPQAGGSSLPPGYVKRPKGGATPPASGTFR